MTKEQAIELLKDMNLLAVARQTGIHYNTLFKIVGGFTKQPRQDTMDKLEAYFKKRCANA